MIRGSVAIGLLLGTLLCPAKTSATQTAISYALTIPALPLGDALRQLAEQSDYSLLASSDILPDIQSTPLNGEYSLNEALSLLLTGSGVKGLLQDKMILLVAEAARPDKVQAPAMQTTQSATKVLETLVVRGYRDSLSASQAKKRASALVSDAVFAEDISDFPELNLGDALQRLPGMVAERDNGETRQLGLRGLGPNFVRVQVNGVESLATFNSVFDHRGSAGRTRNFDFNIFAAELFRLIQVDKTYAASQDEGGIAGTIDLVTPKPFDYEQEQATFSVKGAYNDLSQAYSPRLSALFSRQYANLGALLAVAYSETDSSETGHRDWGWRTFSHKLDASIPANTPSQQPADLVGPTVASYTLANRVQQRLGLTSAWQWRVTPLWSVDADLLFAQLQSVDKEYNLANQDPQGLLALQSDAHNTVRFAAFAQADIRSEAKYSVVQTRFINATLKSHYQANERWQWSWLGSLSESQFSSPVHDKIFLQAPHQPFSFDYGEDRRLPVNRYGEDLRRADIWQLHRADVREDEIRNRFYTGELNGQLRLNQQLSLQLGLQYKDFLSEGFERRDDVRGLNALALPFVASTLAHPQHPRYQVADVGQSFDLLLSEGLIGRVSGGAFSRELDEASNRPGTAFDVQEQNTALFAQLDFSYRDLRGNLGLRYLDSQVLSRGEALAQTQGGSFTPVSFSNHYHQWLPAFNLAWDLNDSLTLRLAAGRNLSRPGLSDLRATTDVSIADNRVDNGNPNLTPFIATSWDLGAEYYFAEQNFLGLVLYYKDLDSYIVSQTRLVSFDELNLPDSLLTEDRQGQLFALSQPVNGQGGFIQGAELSSRYEWTPGFGLLANYTYASGDTHYQINGQQVRAPLLALSRHTYNLTLYLENAIGGIRLSTTYRDRYFTQPDNINMFSGVNATQFVDAAAFYRLTERLKLSFEALNLTNEPIDLFASPVANRPLVHTQSGRTFQFGISLSL
ncbi:TonB-dependent receptor [Bowmanella denitrificans]|uniref:TonB-dependent receptor n=1 Tax=Bowmanella denitrificans TaxID=366582 RepID=UPI000C9D16B5|nr:TonB-dependent receptor [Bowmanella denitrificans]